MKKVHLGMLISGAALALIIALCLAAPLICPYGPNDQNLEESLAAPSAVHILGADRLGRDLFTRMLYGGRVTLASALGVVLLSGIIGVPLGLFSGYFGGWFDAIAGRICDVLVSFPTLLLAFIFVAGLGRGLGSAILALGIVYVPMLMRLVRSLTLVEKNKVYIEAARSTGFPAPRILFLHILPNCASTILVQLALDVGYAILGLASLSFLGLGAQPPTADWGAMLDEGKSFLMLNPLLSLAPGGIIVLTVLALNLFCDSVQQYLNPTERALPSFKRGEVSPYGRITDAPYPLNGGSAPVTPPPGGRGPPGPPGKQALLEVAGLTVDLMTATGSVYAVNGVSFNVRQGEIHGLVGESGCGKSVTVKAIMGLFDKKRSRIAGSVRLKDRELLGAPEPALRRIRGRRVSMIFQDPMTSLSPLEKAGAQIEEILISHTALSKTERRMRALSLLEKVKLFPPEKRIDEYPFELSGGQQQRVMIASAIACGPELLIADEPTTALDVTIQARILALLRALREESGMAVLLITHNFGVVAEICDRVSVMYAGRIVESAGTADLLSSPAHPYTRHLLDCVPRGRAETGRLRVIAGSPPQLRERPPGCAFAPRCSLADAACAVTPAMDEISPGHGAACHHARLEASRNGGAL